LTGAKLGDFIVGSDANVSVAVVAVGGFVGMGTSMVVIRATLLEGDDKGQMALPGAAKDELQALPKFRYAKCGGGALARDEGGAHENSSGPERQVGGQS